MEATIHYGIDVAQYKLNVDSNASNIQILLKWARDMIEQWDITLDTPNYEVLLSAPEHFEVTDTQERQLYFRTIFADCLKKGREEATAENNVPVYRALGS